MSRLELERLESIDAIRRAAADWNRLWRDSDVTLPTARAETVALWLEHFAPREPVCALAVREQERMVAVLPLVGRRFRNVLPLGDLTSNCWSSNGELLLDPAVDANAALDRLAEGLDELPWPLVWLDLVPIRSARWQKLVEALRRRGLAVDVHPRYEIGQTEISASFDDYLAGQSKNGRKGLRRKLQRLKRDGPVELRVLSELGAAEVATPLRQAFEVEQKSWKRQEGTTVLATPGVFEFFVGQSEALAARGQFSLMFLDHCGEPIAFELGWRAKGVYHCVKIGFDSDFRRVSPGQLLRMLSIERFSEDPDCRLIDFQGPLTGAIAGWTTRSYEIGRLVIAPRRAMSRALLAAYRTAAPIYRALRR